VVLEIEEEEAWVARASLLTSIVSGPFRGVDVTIAHL